MSVTDGRHEVLLVAADWTAGGPLESDEAQLMLAKRKQDDDDRIVAALPEQALVGRGSRVVTMASGGAKDACEWQEDGQISQMVSPHAWAADAAGRSHLVAIGVSADHEYGIVTVRDPDTMGQLRGKALVGWIRDMDAAWVGQALLACVVTQAPATFTTLRQTQGENLEKVLEVWGVRSQSVAVATSPDGVVAAYVADGLCHLVDPVTGDPLADAIAGGETYGVVTGPYGTRFLLGAEVHPLPPLGHELPWLDYAFPHGDLGISARSPWLGSWQTRQAHEEARDRAAAARKDTPPRAEGTSRDAPSPPGLGRSTATTGASPAPPSPRVAQPRPRPGRDGMVMDLTEYTTWQGSGLRPLIAAADEEIGAALLSIVSVEGPMLAGHAYLGYLLGAGERPVLSARVKRRLNPLVTALTRQGHLAMIDDRTTGVLGKTLYTPGTPTVVVRELGGRVPELVPASEVLTLLERTGVAPTSPQAVEAVLHAWAKPDASDKARAYLRWCMDYTWVSPEVSKPRRS